jgi:hypothetical protein
LAAYYLETQKFNPAFQKKKQLRSKKLSRDPQPTVSGMLGSLPPSRSAEDQSLKKKIARIIQGADLEALTWKQVRLLHAHWLHGTAHTNTASVD